MATRTLLRPDGPAAPPRVPAGYRFRACRPADIDALGALYFHSYAPGQACASRAEAVADIRAAFAGEYGVLWPAASLVAHTRDGDLVGAIQIVERAPWPDTPDCPFVIELFTAPAHRRHGIARNLVRAALDVLTAAGRPGLALRVSSENGSALSLYRDLGFREWTPREGAGRIVAR